MKDSVLKSRIEECRQIRDAKRQEALKQISTSLGSETARELELLYDGYSERLYLWLAGLWDAKTGGFYYSCSARDNDGFLPDIETTVQALHFTESSGLFPASKGGWVAFLPEKMKGELLRFATGLQSSKDGFFYHPQWGEKITLERKGRDIAWATQLITELGGKPLYDTPNGVKGSLGAPEIAKQRALSSTENVNMASPEYLRSISNFKDFLDSLDFSVQPYVGNKLNAIRSQIGASGKSISDFFINYINEKQNPQTGLWGEGVSYHTVNGFFKMASAIRQLGYKVLYLEQAMKSVMQMLLTPTLEKGTEIVCTPYNCWVALSLIMNNIKGCVSEEEAKRIKAYVTDIAPELIRITRNKIDVFHKPDGGFSFHPDRSLHINQGSLIAVENIAESDVNASCILSSGLTRHILQIFDVKTLSMFEEEDGKLFLDLLN